MGSQRLDNLARRILRVLNIGGPRRANVLSGLRKRNGDQVSRSSFEQSIGQLFLGGYIKATGKTYGKKLAVNGRRG